MSHSFDEFAAYIIVWLIRQVIPMANWNVIIQILSFISTYWPIYRKISQDEYTTCPMSISLIKCDHYKVLYYATIIVFEHFYPPWE